MTTKSQTALKLVEAASASEGQRNEMLELCNHYRRMVMAGAIEGGIIVAVLATGEVDYKLTGLLASDPALALSMVSRLRQRIEEHLFKSGH